MRGDTKSRNQLDKSGVRCLVLVRQARVVVLAPTARIQALPSPRLHPHQERVPCHLLTLQIQWFSLNESHETSCIITLATFEGLQSKHIPMYYPNA